MPRSSHERLPLAVVLPIAVFLIAVGVIAVLYRYAQDRNARLVDNESRALLHQAVMRVEERVDRVLTALSAARARDMRGWGSFGGSEGFTTALVTGAPEILTISRIAGDDALELLYPAEAPAWFDDLRGGLTAVPWRAHALGGSQVVVSPPFRLTQDQRGLAAYVPTQGPGAAGPIINIVFEIDSLLDRVDEVLDGRYSSLLRYVGEDPAHVSIVARDPSEARSMAADPKLLTRPFTVGDQPWRVEISPKLGGVGGGSFLHNELFLVLGLLAGIGLSLLTRQHYLGRQALASSEERYRSVLSDMPDLIHRYRPDGTITFANEPFARYHGRSVESLIGANLFDLYPAKLHGELSRGIDAVRADETTTTERRSLSAGGAMRWQRWSERALLGPDGRIVEIQSIGHDTTEQRRIEEELEHERLRYQRLVEGSPDAILIERSDSILYANSAGATLVGANDASALVGTSLLSLVHPDDRPLVERRKRFAAETGGALRIPELRMVHGAGHSVDVEMIGSEVIFDGRPAAQVIVRDVTDRRRTERKLRESEERFRTIFGSVNDAVLIHDRFGAIFEVNQRACELFGHSRDVLLSMDVGSLIAPGGPVSVREIRDRIAAAHDGEGAQLFEWQARHPERGPWWAEVHLTRASVDGRDRVVSAVRDVTARHDAQEALAAARNRLARLLSTSPIVTYSRGPAPDWETTFVSRGSVQLLGLDPESLVGGDGAWRESIHPADRARVAQELAAAQAGDATFSSEYRLKNREGDYIWIHDEAKLLRGPADEPVEWIGTWRDVTERRRLEQRQRALVTEFGHRMRNALASVLSLLEQTLADEGSPESLARSFRGRIEALSRANQVLAEESWERVDLALLAQRMLDPHRETTGGCVVLEGEPEVLAARTVSPLGLALHELGSNAARFGALSVPGGRVELRWCRESGEGLRLVWRELGGPPTARPGRHGPGLRLVRGLIEHELGGTVALSFAPEGLEVEIVLGSSTAPLAAGAQEVTAKG